MGKKVQETIPETSTNDDFSHYLNESQSTNFFKFSRVSVQEMDNEIMSLKTKKSNNSTYSDKILKYISKLVSPLFDCIIKKSLTSGLFPQLLTIVRVIQTFKACDPNQLGHYRPISVRLNFSIL